MIPQATSDWLKGTRALPLGTKPGALTMDQVLALWQGMDSIRVVCHHAYQLIGRTMPERFISKVEFKNTSVARAQRVLKQWNQHTWHLDRPNPDEPLLSACERFLFAL